MKKLLKTRTEQGKINPYPFFVLVALILAIIFIVFHFVFRNQVF